MRVLDNRKHINSGAAEYGPRAAAAEVHTRTTPEGRHQKSDRHDHSCCGVQTKVVWESEDVVGDPSSEDRQLSRHQAWQADLT